jgi:exosome complex component CSL4
MTTLAVGSQVICRVDRVFPQKAEVTIIAEAEKEEVLRYPMKAQIRIQDTRSFDIDKAAMSDHFFPGDLVRAHMLSIGDMKSCFVSTVGQDFGVIVAKDPDGNPLFPVDQSHMKNAEGLVYKRKVARPIWMKTE